MKNGILLLLGSMLLLVNGACFKNDLCKNKSIDSERATIQAYAVANGITATEHSSGIFYQIINPGSGTVPTASSNVSVKYIGKLTSGMIFDDKTTTAVNIGLSQTIKGWQYGMPLIGEGGMIKLIIPSSLGYGCTGFGTVPESAILYFEIELIDVL